MKRLEGKNIVITGGTSGIGSESAIKLAESGANIMICGRDETRGMQVIENVLEKGVKGKFVKCDVSKGNDVKHFFDEVLSFFSRIDCAFNNAGIDGDIALFEESTEENWDRLINTNLKGI